MEQFTSSWAEWFFIMLLLTALYFVLVLVKRLVEQTNLFRAYNDSIHNLLRTALKFYEPIAILIASVVFISINPVIHGLLIVVLVVIAFPLLRNYVTGRLFNMAHRLNVGQRIQVDQSKGVINEFGRLGINLQTKEGSRFIYHSTLMSKGFVLLKGEEIGGLHTIILKSTNEEEPLLPSVIRNKLFSCPYIDWSFKPKVTWSESGSKLSFQVLLSEENHLSYLIRLLDEWGYETKLDK